MTAFVDQRTASLSRSADSFVADTAPSTVTIVVSRNPDGSVSFDRWSQDVLIPGKVTLVANGPDNIELVACHSASTALYEVLGPLPYLATPSGVTYTLGEGVIDTGHLKALISEGTGPVLDQHELSRVSDELPVDDFPNQTCAIVPVVSMPITRTAIGTIDVRPGGSVLFTWGDTTTVELEITDSKGDPCRLFGGERATYPVSKPGAQYTIAEVVDGAPTDGPYTIEVRFSLRDPNQVPVRGTINVKRR